MPSLEVRYSQISDSELIKAYSEIYQFHGEAQEIIRKEVLARDISTQSIEEEVSQIQSKLKVKAEEPLSFLVILLFIFTGLPGLVFGYFISSVYKNNG